MGEIVALHRTAQPLLGKLILYEVLKRDMETYSARTRKRLVTSGAYQVAKRLIGRVRSELNLLSVTDPDKYAAIYAGDLPVQTWLNNKSDAVVLFMSETKRTEKRDADYQKRLESLRVNFIRIRRAISETWVVRDPAGNELRIESGFPFFIDAQRHSRHAEHGAYQQADNGRGPILVTINPRYIFGPSWQAAAGAQKSDEKAPPAEGSIVTKRSQLPDSTVNTTLLPEGIEQESGGKTAFQWQASPEIPGGNTTRRHGTAESGSAPAKSPENLPESDKNGGIETLALVEKFEEDLLRPAAARGQVRRNIAGDRFSGRLTAAERAHLLALMLENLRLARRRGELTYQAAQERIEKALQLEIERLADPAKYIPHPIRYLDPTAARLSLRYALETWVLPVEASASTDVLANANAPADAWVKAQCDRLRERGVHVSPVQMARWERTKGREHIQNAYDALLEKLQSGKTYRNRTQYFCRLVWDGDYTATMAQRQADQRRKTKLELFERAHAVDKAQHGGDWTPAAVAAYDAMKAASEAYTPELTAAVNAYFALSITTPTTWADWILHAYIHQKHKTV